MDKIMDPEERKRMQESGLSKEQFDQLEEEKMRKEHPEDFEELKTYESATFKKYCEEKYPHEHPEIYENSQILQMIYALEWFDVPKKEYGYLVEYHPYLTKGDHFRL